MTDWAKAIWRKQFLFFKYPTKSDVSQTRGDLSRTHCWRSQLTKKKSTLNDAITQGPAWIPDSRTSGFAATSEHAHPNAHPDVGLPRMVGIKEKEARLHYSAEFLKRSRSPDSSLASSRSCDSAPAWQACGSAPPFEDGHDDVLRFKSAFAGMTEFTG